MVPTALSWQPVNAPSPWALLCPTGYTYGMSIVDCVGECLSLCGQLRDPGSLMVFISGGEGGWITVVNILVGRTSGAGLLCAPNPNW